MLCFEGLWSVSLTYIASQCGHDISSNLYRLIIFIVSTLQNVFFGTPLLRQLIRTGKAGRLVVKGVPGGFLLVLREGIDEQLLSAQRGHARKFKRLETVASYLKDIGAEEYSVELGQWTPTSLDI